MNYQRVAGRAVKSSDEGDAEALRCDSPGLEHCRGANDWIRLRDKTCIPEFP